MTAQLLLALAGVLSLALFLVNREVGAQTEKLFFNEAFSLNRDIEQRLGYLSENTQLLATNELMINAMIDSAGREAYLTPLVSNFAKGKNVLHLDVVDFDGEPVFQMRPRPLTYNQSEELRTALALNQNSMYINQNNELVAISPIEYYSTTQGALIVSFDLQKIMAESVNYDLGIYTRLLKSSNEVVYSEGYDPFVNYKSYRQENRIFPLFSQLDIILEVGLPFDQYRAPIRKAGIALHTVGLILVIASILGSRWIALRITAPILELSSRVKRAHEGQDVRCSPLGSGDELDNLARAFDERTLMLEYQAQYDDLTKLPNRLLFIDRLQHAIAISHRNNQKFSVLFIDLDRFKEINDSYGHGVGDQLLQVVAEKISGSIRDCDTVARMGGDEFTVLIDTVYQERDVSVILQKLLSLFDKPLTVSGYQFYLSCSIGAAIYPADGQDADELLKNADAAMYKAKAEGRNRYCFYQKELTDTIVERVRLEHSLRYAIEQNQFKVFFQPQYELHTGKILGMEALLRWQHPEEGLIPPFRFIPLAEENGMIVEIDRMMMLAAMEEFSQWQATGLQPGVLSMNLSMIQLAQDDFFEFVTSAIKSCNLQPVDIMFEVTETQAMLNPEQTVIMLEQLKSLGVGLAIDDFGTGFSSLAYLKRFPVNKLKIDRSFISNIPNDKEDEKLARAIIALSESLSLSVIAEGVESQEQAEFLRQHGCLEGQGYFFSKPVPGDQLVKLLSKKP